MIETEKNTIKVILRTRPTPSFATKNILMDTNENMITVNLPKNEEKGLVNNQKESWTFKFDKILHNVSQEEMFDYSAREILEKSIEGFNGTLIAYGQTGSGKTFTMSGSPNNYSYRGIIPRAITKLFQEIGKRPEYEFNLFDLLSPIPTYEQKGDIGIQEDSKGTLVVKGLSKHTINNEEEALNLLFEGEANRTISEHQLNKQSTRSHCVFSVYLEMKSRIESSEKVRTSKLNFVDLAGSERVKKTGSTGLTLKEANYINKSLTFLEQVVVGLSDNKKKPKSEKAKSYDHVPYRQSKLTHLLKDSIGGNCRTVLIATIMPEIYHLHETTSTLNFAKRMMNVVNEFSVNIQLDTAALLKKYAKEIKELKQELAMHNTLANRGRINYDELYSPEEQYELQDRAWKFLTWKTDDIEFDSVRQAKHLFHQCRILYKKHCVDGSDISEAGDKNLNKNQTHTLEAYKKSMTGEDGVGVLEIKPSFGIGLAMKDARPITKMDASGSNFFGHNSDGENEKVEKNQKESVILSSDRKETEQITETYNKEDIPDKNTAFKMYKELIAAKEIEEAIKYNNDDLRNLKASAKDLMESCNESKQKIEELKILLNEKKLNSLNLGTEMANVIDEEEYRLIDELKHYKSVYKENLDKFKNAKADIQAIKGNLDLLKLRLVEGFEQWFFNKFRIRLEDFDNYQNRNKYKLNEEESVINALDPEELAYINAKKKVQTIKKAKKLEKIKK